MAFKSFGVLDASIRQRRPAKRSFLFILGGEKRRNMACTFLVRTLLSCLVGGCRVLVERSCWWSVFPQGYRGSIKGRTMASAHFSLSLQQICQSCSETSLISPRLLGSAFQSNLQRARRSSGRPQQHCGIPRKAGTRRRPQPFQLFQRPRDIGGDKRRFRGGGRNGEGYPASIMERKCVKKKKQTK